MKILFASKSEKPELWVPLLRAALPRDEIVTAPSADVDVALVATPPAGTFEKLGRPKLIQSLWMGVEGLLADPALPLDVPLARLLDPGMVAAMSEMVLACVLDWHRHLYEYREQQRARRWNRLEQKLASDRRVAILGLGALGSDAARKLVALDFEVVGFSRRPKDLPGVRSFTRIEEAAREADVLVCLLPLTPATRGILNAAVFGAMRHGGAVLNFARGAQVVLPDLLAALDSGRLARAYLDVFEREPLSEGDSVWSHPRVCITPHIGALTEPRTAVPKIVDNIERLRRGEAPRDTVDFRAGY